jgi:hypothetical protein
VLYSPDAVPVSRSVGAGAAPGAAPGAAGVAGTPPVKPGAGVLCGTAPGRAAPGVTPNCGPSPAIPPTVGIPAGWDPHCPAARAAPGSPPGPGWLVYMDTIWRRMSSRSVGVRSPPMAPAANWRSLAVRVLLARRV